MSCGGPEKPWFLEVCTNHIPMSVFCDFLMSTWKNVNLHVQNKIDKSVFGSEKWQNLLIMLIYKQPGFVILGSGSTWNPWNPLSRRLKGPKKGSQNHDFGDPQTRVFVHITKNICFDIFACCEKFYTKKFLWKNFCVKKFSSFENFVKTISSDT